MNKQPQSCFKWLAGWIFSLPLLAACPLRTPYTQDGELGPPPSITVSLSAEEASFGATKDVFLKVNIRNETHDAVRLLKWQIPADDVDSDIFQVLRDGRPVPYTGLIYKRPAPQEDDFVTLPPGGSVTKTVNLSQLYDLSLTSTYSIRYNAKRLYSYSAKLKRNGTFRTNSINIWIEGRSGKEPEDTGIEKVETIDKLTFAAACTAEQRSDVQDAVKRANKLADESVKYLDNPPSATKRYVTWFGAFSPARWNIAKRNFAEIKIAAEGPLAFDCRCPAGEGFARLDTKKSKIILCPRFWSAGTVGIDSKGGVLIHELSHLVARTGDDLWASGYEESKELAKTEPDEALKTADNYEYFAENTPPLP